MNILEIFKTKHTTHKAQTRCDKKVWNMWEHTGWGNDIEWLDWGNRIITGHLPIDLISYRELKTGDEVRSKMKSNKIAKFEVTEVKWMDDPNDQFFATLKDINYE